MAIAKIKSTLDFLLRLAFFAAAPFLLVFVAELFPVSGAIVQIALALVVFFTAEAIRGLAERSKIAKYVLANQLQFEAYYRANPPRPFLYYVFYPALFPYWLASPKPREEFLLYKGYTLASFGMLLASLVLGYVSAFPPELSVRDFLPIAAGTFVAETVVVLMFLMPMVTSVVHFHTTRARWRLVALLVVGAVSIGFAAAKLERRRDPMVSYATRTRVRLRSDANAKATDHAMISALHEANKVLAANKSDIDRDGKVEGAPLDKAHDALATFYKNDEANAFDLWYSKKRGKAMTVLYFEGRRGQAPIWRAIDETGAATHDEKRLPPGAFAAMRRAAN